VNRPSNPSRPNDAAAIHIVGARQNNLRDVDVVFPKGQLTAVTGVSGSGKSSLVFDTLYAEGQRRYVESFSTYARQFLERMDRPDMERIDGLMPAIALEQRNTIRSARATLATLTELTEYLKLLFAARAVLYCPKCGKPVLPDTPGAVADRLLADHADARAIITFPFRAGKGTDAEVALAYLASEGFTRILGRDGKPARLETLGTTKKLGKLDVIADRLSLRSKDRARIVEALELAYRMGEDDATVHLEGDDGLERQELSRGRRCCDVSYPAPRPGMFSFGSPLGACETCNGFGRVMGVDMDRVVPDGRLPLAGGAIKPWQSPKRSRERRALLRACQEAGVDAYAPWSSLTDAEKTWVFEGGPGRQSWRSGWPGVRAWFKKLERKVYRMHVRILLARYRSYTTCPDCDGTRLKPLSLLYRVGDARVSDVLAMSVSDARAWLDSEVGADRSSIDEELLPVVEQLGSRLGFLDDVGLGYLTLDRQARTLSGGEVQRANLTTAVGSGLVNTLFVFDEPSVGLHARDADRVARLLRELTTRENTVVVVEHDPDILRYADHVVEVGPGPGVHGGQIVYEGHPTGLVGNDATATGKALQAERSTRGLARRDRTEDAGLRVVGATAQNLNGVSATFPGNALTVVTGVSGSGKSTLIEQVLHRGIKRARGIITDRPGACEALNGIDDLGDVIWVDAAPPASNPRANPATYVKAWQVFRGQLAKQPLAMERGYKPGTFSFNSGKGRCPACEGAGVERVEMQFLSDVFLTCEACEGRRFKEDVLEVRWNGRNAADILELTIDEALEVYAQHRVSKKLRALADAGLGYLRLGQPLATLSGGEAQRLKLAYHASVVGTKGALLLLDEPTTGQHLEDVRNLVANLRALVDAGNTVVVIEHHLDVIAAADHIVDLGPDGGDAGGELVFQGPPAKLVKASTETGRQLKRWLSEDPAAALFAAAAANAPPAGDGQIVVEGARVNNLKNVSVQVPRAGRTVISGVSGSGKSSLAFDLIFAEGQRRFLDCLSPYARQYIAQLGRPDADRVYGIPPTVAIEQRTTRGGRWSTVANVTEIEPFLRILWARIGRAPDAYDRTADDVIGLVLADANVEPRTTVAVQSRAVYRRKGLHRDVFELAAQRGYATIVNGERHPVGARPELRVTKLHEIIFDIGEVAADDTSGFTHLLDAAASVGDRVLVGLPDHPRVKPWSFSMRDPDQPRRPLDPRLFSPRTEVGRCPGCEGKGYLDVETEDGLEQPRCPECAGERLGPMGRETDIRGMVLPELLTRTPSGVLEWIHSVHLGERERAIAEGPLKAIAERLQFLTDVGLDYLTLDRRVPTLSGGEGQRIRLAAQLGAHLSGVLYVLDEPTIGLHPTDVDMLLETLDELQERGNGVLMVEHDERTLRTADVLVDVGPGAGREGGEIIAAGAIQEVLADVNSVTGRCLTQDRPRVRQDSRSLDDATFLELAGVRHHNIRGADVRVPRGRLTVVTGVSGSGKSSLAIDVLRNAVKGGRWSLFDKAAGTEGLERFVLVDDKPIGKNPRSTPATYVGVWDHIRTLFAKLPEAKVRGFTKSRFSFNVKGGRCDDCAGQGQVKLEMSFLPNAYVECQTCGGARFNRQTLRVNWQGHSIADVLDLSVRDAVEVFDAVPKVKRALSLLNEVGLGYLQLGQPSPTLSGGEAQRVKLVGELLGRGRSDSLVVLDEPTIGLHMADVPKLLSVFHRLVDSGATVVVIEHNLDVAREADWLIDMGPGPGIAGGEVVYQGPFEGLREVQRSATGRYLRESG